MSFFGKLFGGKGVQNKNSQSKNTNYSYVLEIAGIISSNNERLCENIELSLADPAKYFEENAERFGERCIDVKTADRDTLHWISLVDELSECGFLFGVDYKCELEDFLWALEQLKSFGLISKEISELEFGENDDPVVWGRQINNACGGACVCWVDIDSDSYELIIVTDEVYEKISRTAENSGHRIVKF